MGQVDVQVGEKVRDLRVKAKLSQAELAKKMGVQKPQSVSAIETGKTSATVGTLKKIADGLGVDLFHLFLFESDDAVPTPGEIRRILEKSTKEERAVISKIISILANK